MKVRPLDPNTRIRNDHNTAGAIVGYAQPSDVLEGEEIFTATSVLSNSNGPYQMVGDIWLQIPTKGWIALIHMGQIICEEVLDAPVEDWPEYITITTPDGESQIYDKRN